jgi:hypothetical protein
VKAKYPEVRKMPKNNPIEYTGKVLDQRNDLTGPNQEKGTYPERPKHVQIQDDANNKGK